MKDVLKKAVSYTPDAVVNFILQVERELSLENKALFRAIFVEYFLDESLLYPDELEPENKPKKRYYEYKDTD